MRNNDHNSKLIFNLQKEIEEKIESLEKVISNNDIDSEKGFVQSTMRSSGITSFAGSSLGQDENDNVATDD